MAAARASLPGRRWHFQHGPIDLVIGADGDAAAVAAAHEAAWQRFGSLLEELVAELPRLRQPVDPAPGAVCPVDGAVARCMWAACAPFAAGFITPMAAVAGAVAQELIAAYRRPGIERAWIDNGGDIALHLAPGASVRVGVVSDLARAAAAGAATLDAGIELHASQPVRGIATSGWRGRSFSLGIADSVTVLASTAAMADAAATVVANAVDVDAPGIVRRPASELRDDSDLGERMVTVDVPRLPDALCRRALQRGAAKALELQRRGLVVAVLLACQGRFERIDAAGVALRRVHPRAPAAGAALACEAPT